MTPEKLASIIDHTLLKPEAQASDIEQLCREAREYGFASVCIHPVYVPLAVKELKNCPVKVCTVAGFPLGAGGLEAKAAEALSAIHCGAREVDMVIWIGGLKDGRDDMVLQEISELARLCREEKALLKVIIECALLTDEEKGHACELCVRAGAHFVKTSTGFSSGGATVEDVRLMSNVVKAAGLGVKAAGGIRSYEDAMKMVEAGATRIGASASVKIIAEARAAAS